MTKVQLRFRLAGALDEQLMTRIADAHSVYGFQRIRVDGDNLLVDYDATRLNPKEVEATLAGFGIPVEKS
jgi:hypothetical protein